MKKHSIMRAIFTGLLVLLVSACAQKVTFEVTRPSELPVDNIQNMSFGTFENQTRKLIPLPKKRSKSAKTLSPGIRLLASNTDASELVRSLLVSKLSKEGQFHLLNTSGQEKGWNGARPDPALTGLINAKVRYFEKSIAQFEDKRQILLITRGGLSPVDTAAVAGITKGVVAAAERNGKGLAIPAGYIERIAAMDVEYELLRMNNNQAIIPKQKIRAYYIKKWGGNNNTSHLDNINRAWIVTTYNLEESFFESLNKQADIIKLAYKDPQEFIALGGKLKQDPGVPLNSLDVKLHLAKIITDKFAKRISQYTETTTLELAGGDEEAITLIEGNAYEKAINRLENLKERSEGDTYNLALSYESIGERIPALEYYQTLMDKAPENVIYQNAVKRLKR